MSKSKERLISMPVWVLLSFAIVSEVAATIALRYTEGFSRLAPSAVVVVGYGASFVLLALVLQRLSLGVTYAVWAGAGTALIAAFGMLALGEDATPLKLASLALVIAGVIGLNLSGAH